MIRKYNTNGSWLVTRVRRVVAAPPPLATNTRTVVVNPWASVPRFVASHPVPTVDIE